MSLSETQKAYFAGLFDGEGTVGVHCSRKGLNSPSHTMRVSLAKTFEMTLLNLKEAFGGNITAIKRPGFRQAWIWTLSSQKAASFLESIRQFVRVKRPQVELALLFQGGTKNGSRPILAKVVEERESLRLQISDLNNGVPAAVRAPQTMQSEALAYTAGFFDGEGTIVIDTKNPSLKWKRKSPSHSVRVSLTNTDAQSVCDLLTLFGGHVSKVAKQAEHHKQAWRWKISSRKATAFLALVEPYLVIKQEQAKVALEFQAGIGKSHGPVAVDLADLQQRQRFMSRISELNQGDVG